MTRFEKQMPYGCTLHEYYEGLIDILEKCIKSFKARHYSYEPLDFNQQFSLVNDNSYLELLDFVGTNTDI